MDLLLISLAKLVILSVNILIVCFTRDDSIVELFVFVNRIDRVVEREYLGGHTYGSPEAFYYGACALDRCDCLIPSAKAAYTVFKNPYAKA